MMQTPDIIQGGLTLAQIGAFIYLIRVVIAPQAKAIETMSKAIEELYTSRNDNRERIIKIETIHHMRGCDDSAPSKK